MKWFNAYQYKPKDQSSIWVWNTTSQKQELWIANWIEGIWDANKMSYSYARMWAYVFESDEPIDQPERSKREDFERRCGALNIVETQ